MNNQHDKRVRDRWTNETLIDDCCRRLGINYLEHGRWLKKHYGVQNVSFLTPKKVENVLADLQAQCATAKK